MGIRRQSRRLSLATVSWAVLGWTVLGSHSGLGAGEPANVQSLLKQGLYSYEEGDLDSAVAAFEGAFALDPSNDALLTFVENATHAKLFEMVRSKDPRVSGVATQILRTSKAVIAAKVGDPVQIAEAVESVLSAKGEEQLTGSIRATATFGRNLVPTLIPVLAHTDLARRTTAINWIARIGVDAVPVLQAARKHPNPTVRRNVAYLLGVRTVRHPVGLATLKAMAETDPVPEVRQTAEVAFGQNLSDLNGRGEVLAAKEYFLRNAYEVYYLNPHRNPFAGTHYAPTVYRLEGAQVVGERVAEFQLGNRMARIALEEALELDPSFVEARVLSVCNDAEAVVDYDLNVEYYAKHEGQGNQEILASQKPYVDYVLRNRLFAPQDVLFEALLQSLDDGKSDVTRKIIDTIRETIPTGRMSDSLVKALEDSNSRLVRTAAAIAIAYWNPIAGFDAGDQVVDILGDAVVTSGIRTVQKVIGDKQLANNLDEMFRDLNMESYSPIPNIERGYQAVINMPPDVVFMDETVEMISERPGIAPINFFVTELRKNYRSANVPVVVVVPAARLEQSKGLYASEERKVWVVPDSIDRLSLNNTVFQKLFGDKDDAKARATKLAAAAGEALLYLSSVPTRIPVRKSVPKLLAVLKNRPDEVRIPCIKALGRLRVGESTSELAIVFGNAENAHEVRVEAMRSVAQALLSGGGAAPTVVMKAIRDGMKDLDLELRRMSWLAFANAGAEPKAQYEALIAQAPGGQPAAGAGAGAAVEPVEPVEPEEGADATAADATTEEPAEAEEVETTEEPAEDTMEEPAADTTEEPAADTTEEPAADTTEEPAGEESDAASELEDEEAE